MKLVVIISKNYDHKYRTDFITAPSKIEAIKVFKETFLSFNIVSAKIVRNWK